MLLNQALGVGKNLIESPGVKLMLPSGEFDSSVLTFQDEELGKILPQFIDAIAARRHFERETDPPSV